jgi:hypothetical protein
VEECDYKCENGACVEEQQDTQPPITSASVDPSKWYPNPVQVTLNCYDSESGCKHTYYCYDTAIVCEPSKKGNSLTIECNAVCVYYLRYYSVDKEGNEERVKSVRVQIDNKAPETVYKGPEGVVTGRAEIELECKDSGSGCAVIKYRLDGSNQHSYMGKFMAIFSEFFPMSQI